MRIGIDCRSLKFPLTGVDQYCFQLTKKLLGMFPKSFFVVFLRPEAVKLFKKNSNVEYVVRDWGKIPFVTNHLIAGMEMRKHNLDVMHFLSAGVPFSYRGKSVITVHDVAAFIHPEWFEPSPISRMLLKRSMRLADAIITPSEVTRNEVEKLFQRRKNVVTVSLAAEVKHSDNTSSEPAISQPQRESDPYFFFYGTLEPRKNLVRLIHAYAKSGVHERLIIAGKKGWKYEAIDRAIRQNPNVSYLGYVSDEQRNSLLLGAKAFLWPTLYEGFGLPVLEAMTLGVPVLTSKGSSMEEVCGEAAILVDPKSEDEISAMIKQLSGDENLRRKLSEAGKKRSALFSWERCARETYAVYNQVMEQEGE